MSPQTETKAQDPAVGLKINTITKAFLKAVGGRNVVWKSAPTSLAESLGPRQHGLEYMRESSRIRRDWDKHWPTTVPQPAWDLIGRAQTGKSQCWEWVLVKIYRDPAELNAGKLPKEAKALKNIQSIFKDAKSASRAPADADWLNAGFDLASRIAIRAHLTSNGACGRMVFLCIGGDEWKKPIQEAKARFAIPEASGVANRISWTIAKN